MRVADTAAELGAIAAGEVSAYTHDVSTAKGAAALAAAVLKDWPELDVLVNNAAVYEPEFRCALVRCTWHSLLTQRHSCRRRNHAQCTATTRAFRVCSCKLQQRRGISTGAARSESASRKATPAPIERMCAPFKTRQLDRRGHTHVQ